MTLRKSPIIAAVLVALPQLATAEAELTVGGAVTSAFDAGDGLDHIENTAEIFVEGGYNGFHTGIWIGSIYDDPTDDFEYELSLGYGGEAGRFGYDVTYTGYYLDSSGYDHSGLGAELSYALTDQLSGAVFAEVDPDSNDWDREISLEFAVSDKITTWAMVGKSDADANNYGEIGISYAFNDIAGIEALYEDADDSDGTLSLSLTFETSVLSQ